MMRHDRLCLILFALAFLAAGPAGAEEAAWYVPPPSSQSTPTLASPPRAPDWTRNSRFLALGGWGGSVDRVGILTTPAAPVAWKGERPKVLFVWTGRDWHQIIPRAGEGPLRTLRGKIYDLTRLVHQSESPWGEADTPFLYQQVRAWNYDWMGPLSLVPSF